MPRLNFSVAGLTASVCVVLLPLLSVPFLQVAAEDQKGIVAGLMLGAALLVAAGIVLLSSGALFVRFSAVSLVGVPLALVAFVSALVGAASQTAWLGEALEFGTVASYSLFALAFCMASLAPSIAGRRVLYIFIGGALVSGIFTTIVSMMGGGSGILSNWPTVSAAAALALVCAAVLADWSDVWGEREWVLAVANAVLLICTLLFFNVAYIVAASMMLLVFILARAVLFATQQASRLPVLSLVLLLAFVAAITLGMRGPLLKLPPDIRPSLEATELVSGPLLTTSLQNTLVGVGPESFGRIWNRYRPQEFNQTPLWNTTFKEGNSTAATIFVELGVLGVLAWVLPVIAVAILLVRRVRSLSVLPVASFLGVLCYYVASFLYTTGLTPMLVAGALLGLAVSSLGAQPKPIRAMRLPLRIGAAVPLMLLGLALMVVAALQLISLQYRMLGVAHFEAGNYVAAHTDLARSAMFWATPRLYANDANALLAVLQASYATSTPSVEIINQPIDEINRAMFMDFSDLTVALTRASVYIVLVGPLHIAEAQGKASSSLMYAADLAPNRPEIPYLQAVLAAETRHLEEASVYVAKALKLKPDYQPALNLQKQLTGQ